MTFPSPAGKKRHDRTFPHAVDEQCASQKFRLEIASSGNDDYFDRGETVQLKRPRPPTLLNAKKRQPPPQPKPQANKLANRLGEWHVAGVSGKPCEIFCAAILPCILLTFTCCSRPDRDEQFPFHRLEILSGLINLSYCCIADLDGDGLNDLSSPTIFAQK